MYPTLDAYYQACEDALRCQASKSPLGVVSCLTKAAQLRDAVFKQAQARLEFHTARGILDYWDATLESLPYIRDKAAILLDAFDPKEPHPLENDLYLNAGPASISGGPLEESLPEDPNDWEELADPDYFSS